MKFSELVRGASLRGVPGVFTPKTSLRLGRAVGTLLRRRSEGRSVVVVARGGHGSAELSARDGLCQGLVLSGFDVVDLGCAESDLFTFALRHENATGGALVGTTGESVGVMLFAGPRPLVGEHLVELARVADEGGFCAGLGSMVQRDLRGAFRQAPRERESDTVEE